MTSSEQSPREARIAFADSLIEFTEQRRWYSQRAGSFKTRAQWIDLVIIAAGALVAALPILKPSETHWVDVFVTSLGVIVVIAQGMQRIFRYGDIWPEYRLASERMKRETRLFTNCAERYSIDDAAAQQLYVTTLEEIIADEQKIFFDAHRSSSDANS